MNLYNIIYTYFLFSENMKKWIIQVNNILNRTLPLILIKRTHRTFNLDLTFFNSLKCITVSE